MRGVNPHFYAPNRVDDALQCVIRVARLPKLVMMKTDLS